MAAGSNGPADQDYTAAGGDERLAERLAAITED